MDDTIKLAADRTGIIVNTAPPAAGHRPEIHYETLKEFAQALLAEQPMRFKRGDLIAWPGFERVRVMAVDTGGGYLMLRRPNCMPFIKTTKQLIKEGVRFVE